MKPQVDQPGTYWYHSHLKGQYPDGLRGAFIVNDPDDPHKDLYDSEIVLTFSDWYHQQMPSLIKRFLSVANPTGAEPVPQSALINETQNLTVSVEPGKTYLFRLINIGAFAAHYVWFEGHTMQVVEVDGVYTKPMDAQMLYLTAAQRVAVLVTMGNDTSSNFPFVGSMDEVCAPNYLLNYHLQVAGCRWLTKVWCGRIYLTRFPRGCSRT